MASDDDGDDLVAGETNRCQSGTELIAGTEDGHIGSGNDYVLHVIPAALNPSFPENDSIFGVRAEGFGPSGVAVLGEGRVYAPGDLVPGGTGVRGTGATGVEGSGEVGVRGDGSDAGAEFSGSTGIRVHGGPMGITAAGQIQLQLVPNRLGTGPRKPVVPLERDPWSTHLPDVAQAGSFFSAIASDRECAVWFCVRSGSSPDRPAEWREVLLGSRPLIAHRRPSEEQGRAHSDVSSQNIRGRERVPLGTGMPSGERLWGSAMHQPGVIEPSEEDPHIASGGQRPRTAERPNHRMPT